MGRTDTDIVEKLKTQCRFPSHGIVKRQDGSAVLVFPFVRAIWELWQHNEEGIRQRKVTLRDVIRPKYFRDRWMRLLQVLNWITHYETILQGDQRKLEWLAANREITFWLDLFFFYSKLLADAFTVALGQLLSDAPASFPREAKRLFDNDKSWIAKCRLRCDEEDLSRTICQHKHWFLLIRPDHAKGHPKGHRDAIAHRLCRWEVRVHGHEDVWPKSIGVTLNGDDNDIPTSEALDTIGKVVEGLCSFLSALPLQTWLKQEFEGRDLIISESGNNLGGRFLPTLLVDLDDENR